jgi:hypothetical protein
MTATIQRCTAIALWGVLGLLGPGSAGAQDSAPLETPVNLEISAPQGGPTLELESIALDLYPQDKLQDAEERSRRARIGLLASTGAFAVGTILSAAWAGVNCATESDGLRCDTGSHSALAGVGGAFAAAGVVSMITTGIMLGVRNRQKRQIEGSMESQPRAKLEWDLESGRWRF